METPTIDIYADNPEVTIDYQIAVMQEVKKGEAFQMRSRRNNIFSLCNWYTPDSCFGGSVLNYRQWDWSNYDYRIHPSCRPKTAEGHNPDGLTEDQVGVKDGWRLLNKSELIDWSRTYGYNISCEVFTSNLPEQKWIDAGYILPIHWNGFAFRTKKPIASKIKTRVPLTQDDVPLVCWIRNTHDGGRRQWLVTEVDHDGIVVCVAYSAAYKIPFSVLFLDYVYEYSCDRKTWKPCHKEI